MTYSNKFKTALRKLLVSEGVVEGKQGNVDDPNDSGGRTSGGITQAEYTKWIKEKGLKVSPDVWDITAQIRADIYLNRYWIPMRCEEMPLPIAYMAFDSAVLHGVNFAPAALQEAIGVRADGKIGPVTLAAAKAQDPLVVLKRLRPLRWERMKSRESFEYFKKGWKKRLDEVDVNVKGMLRLPSN